MANKSSLTIRLTEPIVFLRGAAAPGQEPISTQPAMVRGLLTLHLHKAARVKSVELCLQTRSNVIWPEGVGARRMEIAEENIIRQQTMMFFDAATDRDTATLPTRRAISVGPGLHLEDMHDHVEDNPPLRARTALPPRAVSSARNSIRQGGSILSGLDEVLEMAGRGAAPPYSREPSASDLLPPRSRGMALLDGNDNLTEALSPILSSDDGSQQRGRSPLSPLHSNGNANINDSPSPSRGTFRAQLASRSPSQTTLTGGVRFPSEASSSTSVRTRGRAVNRDGNGSGSESDSDPEDVLQGSGSVRNRVTFARRRSDASSIPSYRRTNSMTQDSRPTSILNGSNPATRDSRPSSISNGTSPMTQTSQPGSVLNGSAQHSPSLQRIISPPLPSPPMSRTASGVTHDYLSAVTSRSPAREASQDARGRSRSRARASMMEGVRKMFRSSSREVHDLSHDNGSLQRVGSSLGSAERGPERRPDPPRAPRRGVPGQKEPDEEPRGRLMERGRKAEQKGKSPETHWKEFRKGTYTYPIVFPINYTAPTSVHTDYGSVRYYLLAVVHRAGPFTTRLTAEKEVEVIDCPIDDEPEVVHIERQWEDSLRYLINLDNKLNLVGGEVGIDMTLMPLDKVRIYRLNVSLEEKIDYFSRGNRIARYDTPKRWELLNLKSVSKSTPLLPLVGLLPSAGPLSQLLSLAPSTMEPSEYAASLLHLNGPWLFHEQLKLPMCKAGIHPTTKATRSGGTMKISHILKIVIRVERAEGAETGKKWDIMVDTPLHLFDCRCSAEYISLPTYGSQTIAAILDNNSRCACVPPAPSQPLTPVLSMLQSHVVGSSGSGANSPSRREALMDRNRIFARLVAGLEDVEGEAPPAYEGAPLPA